MLDGEQFDQLSRHVAGYRTRRQAIKALAGAAVAVIAGSRAAAAQTCAPHYSPCGGDADCCDGAVCEYGLCMPGCRIDGAFTSAWMPNPANICQVCTPERSTTAWSPANPAVDLHRV